MQNPIYEEIARKHGISAQEAETAMSEALYNAGAKISPTEFLYVLSEVLLNEE